VPLWHTSSGRHNGHWPPHRGAGVADQNNNRSSPFVVGVSGHRDLHPDTLPQLAEQVAEFLTQLKQHLPDSELRIMAGMATGADLLVVQTALAHECQVDAILPMPLAQYAADFDPDSFRLLKTLLAHPRVRCVELAMPAGLDAHASEAARRDAHYSVLTQTLIRGCSLLIALWDGEPSPLPGGTADTVLRYLGVRASHHRHDAQLHFSDATDEGDLPARLAYWIPTLRAHDEVAGGSRAPCFLAGLGDNALQRVAKMPRRLVVHLRSLNAYNHEYRRFLQRWGGTTPPDSLLRDLADSPQLNAHERSVLEEIDRQYGKADALALYFQKRSDRLFAFFNIVAFAMGLAYLAYEKVSNARMLLLVYLVILVTSAGLYYVLQERHWFAKHLMCRALAETLRVKFYMRLAGGDHLVDAERVLSLSGINRFHGFGWIGHVLTALESPAVESTPQSARAARGNLAWIDNQRQYFVRKVARLHTSGTRTKWLKRILFAFILCVLVALLALGEHANRELAFGISLEHALTFVMGLLAVGLASWELHQNKMATRELLWQYRNQLKHYSRAHSHLARTVGHERRVEILAELAKDSLMESYLWTIHRFHREHEPPGRA
jgi:hypothetical protein